MKTLLVSKYHDDTRSTYAYILLSLVFVVLNLFTLNNLAPWVDEAMFIDTSYNAAIHGSWETTAWYRVVGEYPFSTYPPLYQLLATVWIWLFGGSLMAVRGLNLLITFLLGAATLQFLRRYEKLNLWTVVLFTILLWGTSEMAWMYRNGRPDMLEALLFVFTVQAVNSYLSVKSRSHCAAVIVTSALLLSSGIQAAVYLCALWLFLFIVMKGRRKEAIRLLGLIVTGIFLGLVLVTLFMIAHGRLMAFGSSIIQYSSTLTTITLAVLPLAGDVFGFDPTPFIQKLQELSTSSSLTERLSTIVEYHSFIILAVTALIAYLFTFRNKLKNLTGEKGFLLLLFALYTPLVMNLAGRFAPYYRWMAFMPLLAAIVLLAARSRLWRSVCLVVALLLTVMGIRSLLPNDQWNYTNVQSFVERQHFKKSDAVVCPFSTFYEIKPVCDTCYFAGIFPTEFIERADYVIEAPNGDEFDQPISDYVNKLREDTTIVLTVMDHCEHPSLTLYRIDKHE